MDILDIKQNPAIGDVVYYESPTAEYALKCGRVVELRMGKPCDRLLTLANTQRRIEKLERILKVLGK